MIKALTWITGKKCHKGIFILNLAHTAWLKCLYLLDVPLVNYENDNNNNIKQKLDAVRQLCITTMSFSINDPTAYVICSIPVFPYFVTLYCVKSLTLAYHVYLIFLEIGYLNYEL